MTKDPLFQLILSIAELADIIALLSYFTSELDKSNKKLGEQENRDQNPDNDNANDLDFRCKTLLKKKIQQHEIKKLKQERDKLFEELKTKTQEALVDASPDLSKALKRLAADLESLSKATKEREALEALSKANKEREALEAIWKSNKNLSDDQSEKASKDLSDDQSEDADYNSENE